jgi:hypothetical protein
MMNLVGKVENLNKAEMESTFLPRPCSVPECGHPIRAL